MTSAINWMLILSLWAGAQQPAGEPTEASSAIQPPLSKAVRAVIRVERTTIPVGSPVYVEFALQNRTGEPVTLTVPGALEGKPQTENGMGLPLEHVFSCAEFRGLSVVSEGNPYMGDRVTQKPQYPIPPITIAPFGTVGLRFDVARFYPGLHQSGVYVLKWQPYGGALASKSVTIKVVAYKQAIIETDAGSMKMDFLYDKAPHHVENFIELADKRFYNGKTFHMLVPNQFILGGCPIGDGTGKRPDGETLSPEFNDTEFKFGTVGMAIVASDPNSASCQFFICLSPQPAWKGRYTAFAKINGPESEKVLRRLGQRSVKEGGKPIEKITIKSITIRDVPYVPRQDD